jgi:ABC-type protease/lipase transport system fused ATPase/permease subunit
MSEKPIEKSVPVSPPQFTMRDVDLSIPKGSFCAIVGPVGGGKSTLVGGLVGGSSIFFVIWAIPPGIVYLITPVFRNYSE